MRKTMKLDGEICPNCAAKIQAAVEKVPGVNEASVNAFMLKFTLDADDERFEGALDEALRIFDDIEPDCEVLVPSA